MPFTLRGPLPVLAATVLALGLVPGSASSPRAGNADAHRIAVGYLSQNAAELGVARADVADLAVTSTYRSRASGITHVNLNQRYEGLEVFDGHVTVNVAPDGAVVFVGGDLVEGLKAATAATPAVGAVAAVEAAADALDLDEPDDLRVLSSRGGRAHETVVSDGGISAVAIPARLGWQPTGSGLRLAWQLVIDAASEEHLWNATVDANSGKLLAADDWTVHDDLDALATTLPRSSGAQSTTAASLGTPTPVDDGSSYRVLGVPTESPNDADRVLLTNPADALASPFGWHDTNAAPGAEFTITRGNNVHAYLDQEDDEAPDFGDTDGGAGLDFDFPADLTEHAQHYRDAVVTNLFYGCNAFHDIYYRYGFDEEAGNFQANNYGRGGLEGDYVRCEAADGSGTNNANFSTPTEPTATGAVPRMQMFLWPGNQLGPQNQVLVNGVTSIGAGWARFGPPATKAGVAGTIVLVDDGEATPPVGTVNDGCERYSLPAGSIALVDRANTPPAPPPNQPPTCSFLQQVQNAAAAGAVAVIIANNTGGNAPIVNGPTSAATPDIPTVSLTQDNGAALKQLVPAPAMVRKHPDHPGIRDGDFENGIIFHEFGHGLSNRLTGGPAVNCLSGNEQAGEGWSDYVAIAALLDPALDDPNGPRGMGPYALFQANRQGNGIRPRPYSRNMEIQPFTYDSIKTNGWLNGTSLALPHGLGHGWAAVLWDLTWDLIDKHGLNPNVYGAWDSGGNNRAIQYVVEGMKLQGCGPGLVVSSRAVIAAANALTGGTPDGVDGLDTCTVWASFARRGLGHSAVQGTTNRNDNEEAFDTHPECRRGFLAPVAATYGTLNTVVAGDARPLRFTADGYRARDVLASQPYSRLVDCATLKTVDASSPFITPRPVPVAAQSPGGSGLTVSATGIYTFPWLTDAAWAGSCREFVLTRKDGKQHRAFFRFVTE